MKCVLQLIVLFLLLSVSCDNASKTREDKGSQNPALSPSPFALSSKPYARYWWFASVIKEEDVRFNLDWLKANGFGGVEVAWVYPLNRFNKNDTSYTPRQEWLSSDWTKIVDYTIRYADSIGLGCDLTFGTLWPFGDTYVTFEQATQHYGDPEWRQQIRLSWQHPKVGYVIDHLSQNNYQPYFNRLLKAFPRPDIKSPQAYFIDSWEVETEKLWCEGFDRDFQARFGYDIIPFMDSVYRPGYGQYLYDYMTLVSDKVLKFYADYDSTINSAGILSRGQVSGAPCDLISGYAKLDIPEGESMLFEPEYCAIPASAALLSGKKYVSSETFTCLYGWPRDYIRQEQMADLKLVADALFANGINHIIWHGKAHNPENSDSINFYATTHIGFSGSLAEEIPQFNRYLEKVSSYMSKGHTYSDIAVYLPTEDAWIKGLMPKEKQFKWAWGYYEMRYVYFPDELAGYNPSWINGEFLEKATFEGGNLKIGNALYHVLYVDVEYLDYKALKRIAELAEAGLAIIIEREPKEPGMNKHPDYDELVKEIRNSKFVTADIPVSLRPFITGKVIPRHWCREEGEALYVYFSNPKADRLKFPMEYGQSLNNEMRQIQITLQYSGNQIDVDLEFKPYQSLLYKIENGKAEKIDIEFVPKTPVVQDRPAGYKAPWLVE
jgi:hypothetical protein